jgi:aryl carrier-like protein
VIFGDEFKEIQELWKEIVIWINFSMLMKHPTFLADSW